MKEFFIITILYLISTNYLNAQFQFSVFTGPSITKNRLLFEKVEPSEFAYYEGPSYKLFYNIGLGLCYNLTPRFGAGFDFQFKKIGSDRLFKVFQPLDTFQNSWQTYFSLPVYLFYKPHPKFRFDIGITSNYRHNLIESISGHGIPSFDNTPKLRKCFDFMTGINFKLDKHFDLRIRWEEGLDVIDNEDQDISFFVKNRAFHFNLVYTL